MSFTVVHHRARKSASRTSAGFFVQLVYDVRTVQRSPVGSHLEERSTDDCIKFPDWTTMFGWYISPLLIDRGTSLVLRIVSRIGTIGISRWNFYPPEIRVVSLFPVRSYRTLVSSARASLAASPFFCILPWTRGRSCRHRKGMHTSGSGGAVFYFYTATAPRGRGKERKSE